MSASFPGNVLISKAASRSFTAYYSRVSPAIQHFSGFTGTNNGPHAAKGSNPIAQGIKNTRRHRDAKKRRQYTRL
jgi:hypothetical protein